MWFPRRSRSPRCRATPAPSTSHYPDFASSLPLHPETWGTLASFPPMHPPSRNTMHVASAGCRRCASQIASSRVGSRAAPKRARAHGPTRARRGSRPAQPCRTPPALHPHRTTHCTLPPLALSLHLPNCQIRATSHQWWLHGLRATSTYSSRRRASSPRDSLQLLHVDQAFPRREASGPYQIA